MRRPEAAHRSGQMSGPRTTTNQRLGILESMATCERTRLRNLFPRCGEGRSSWTISSRCGRGNLDGSYLRRRELVEAEDNPGGRTTSP